MKGRERDGFEERRKKEKRKKIKEKKRGKEIKYFFYISL